MTSTTTRIDRSNRLPTSPDASRLAARVGGILRLDRATVRDIARDPTAQGQATLVVVGAAIGRMIVSPPDGSGAALVLLGETLAAWVLGALLIAGVMPGLIGTPTSRAPRQDIALRVLGFAHAPLLLGVLGVIGPLAGLAGLVGWVLTLVTTMFAVTQLLGVSWVRAAIATVATRVAVAVLIGMAGIVVQIGTGILRGIG